MSHGHWTVTSNWPSLPRNCRSTLFIGTKNDGWSVITSLLGLKLIMSFESLNKKKSCLYLFTWLNWWQKWQGAIILNLVLTFNKWLWHWKRCHNPQTDKKYEFQGPNQLIIGLRMIIYKVWSSTSWWCNEYSVVLFYGKSGLQRVIIILSELYLLVLN